jgi:hypothetical protein
MGLTKNSFKPDMTGLRVCQEHFDVRRQSETLKDKKDEIVSKDQCAICKQNAK